ncbi:MAG: hypothetical protein Q9191_004026 [Dirinaria sp. TL-2023a]
MADVRSMLRSERQARRLTHPHLAYSTTGTIVCLVCHIQLKSVNLWNKHLGSDQHAMRLQRIRDNALGRPPGAPPPPEDPDDQHSEPANGSKKRKADDLDEDTRKKSKPTSSVAQQYFEDEEAYNAQFHLSESDEDSVDGDAQDTVIPEPAPTESQQPVPEPAPTVDPPKATEGDGVDEDEWAAFERDVATPPPEPSALTAEATISAAPISAAELAAQSREEANVPRKSLREAELEAEKEDAARQMEEEFDQMAELEERVKRLREKREQLRAANAEGEPAADKEIASSDRGSEEVAEKDDVDDSSDEFDEWDRWAR